MPTTPRRRDPAAVLTAPGSHKCAWHEYVEAQYCPQDAALSSLERHAVILKEIKEWKNLAEEDKTLWKDRASTTRRQAASRGAPVDAVLALQAAGDVTGGPWAMSARRGNAPTEWPLSRFSISKQLRQSNLADAAEAWTSATSVVWEEPDDFPDAAAAQQPCKLGECIHGLRPVEEHRLETIGTEISLALRHSGLPSHCPLCFQLLCGDEVRYCWVGDHDWTHKLRADLILMAPTIDGRHSDFPFELVIQRNREDDSIASGWPVI